MKTKNQGKKIDRDSFDHVCQVSHGANVVPHLERWVDLHPAMATVDLNAVSKIYGTTVGAVYSVDLSISDGEFIVLVGPPGRGKSTTLRMIAGLELIGIRFSSVAGDLPP